MNQHSYLHQLEFALKGLPRPLIDETLADCREYFRDGLADGRSEEDIARALGEPQQLARELRAKATLQTWEEHKSFSNFWRVVAATAGLGVLNFLLAIPLLVYLWLLTCGVLTAFGLSVAGLLLLLCWGGNALFGWPDDQMLLSNWQQQVHVSGNGRDLAINIDGDDGEHVFIGQASGVAGIHIESPDGSVHIQSGANGGSVILQDGQEKLQINGLPEHGKRAVLIIGLVLLLIGGLGLLLGYWLIKLTARLLGRYIRYQLALLRNNEDSASQRWAET